MHHDVDVIGRITDVIVKKSDEFISILKKRDGQVWVDNPNSPAECDKMWPESMEHAVWLKNRAPARALKKRKAKTPWEAMTGDPPNLTRERTWGSTTYTSFRPEKRQSKLHDVRAWYGWFIGCDGEAIYRIYSPDLKRVIRVGQARMIDGDGLNDSTDIGGLEEGDEEQEDDEESASDSDGEHGDDDIDMPEEQDENLSQRLGSQEDDEAPTLEMEQDLLDRLNGVAGDLIDPEENSVETDNDQTDDNEEERQRAAWDITNIEYGIDDYDSFFAGAVTDGTTSKYFDVLKEAIGPLEEEEAPNAESDFVDSESDDEPETDEPLAVKKKYREVYINSSAGPVKNLYLLRPDDLRCDHCFRMRRKCDKDHNGIPCTVCTADGLVCREQTKETKALIPKANRDKPILKQIIYGQRVDDDRCRLCFKLNRRCIYSDPTSEKCDVCLGRSEKTVCTKDKTGAVKGGKKSTGSAGSKKIKCERCRSRKIKCDGKKPCNNCAKLPQASKRCDPKDIGSAEEAAGPRQILSTTKCLNCNRSDLYCDGNRPCATCVRAKSNCAYTEQEGLVTRTYAVEGAKSLYRTDPP